MSLNSKDIYFSLKYFFYGLKFSGLASFEFDRRHQKFKVGMKNRLELSVIILMWLGFIWFQLQPRSKKYYDIGVESRLLDALNQYQYLLQYFLIIPTIIFNFIRRNNVESYLKLICDIDHHLERLDWKFKVKPFSPFIGILLFISPLITVTIYLVSEYFYYFQLIISTEFFVNVLLDYLSYILLMEFYFMLSIQYILSVYFIHVRMSVLTLNIL